MERPLRESLTIEFKSDRKCYALSKLYGDLVGMANTDGGWLFLGIEDDGTVTGVDNQHKNCQFMEANIQDNTIPSLFVKSHIEIWEGKEVLAIEVPVSRQLMMTDICAVGLKQTVRPRR